MQATDEQIYANEKFVKGERFKVIAFAGSGKTSTLKIMANNSNYRKGAYLAFNKRLAEEAKSKFPNNIQCMTFHGLAYRNTPRWMLEKLKRPRIFSSDIAKKLNINAIKLNSSGEEIRLSGSQQASIALKALEDFCKFSSDQISFKNVLACIPKHIPKEFHIDLADHLAKYTYELWLDMVSEKGAFSINHNIYFKHWCLGKPYLPFDFILADEAQDLSATQYKLMLDQSSQQLIFCGDMHQQIYGWRGAVNAMQQLPLTSCYLTQSFRFGNEIAEVANLILQGALNEERKLRATPTIKSKVHYDNKAEISNGILCRTNAVAFTKFVELSVQNIPVQIAFDADSVLNFLKDAEKLKSGISIDSGDLLGFQDWNHLLEYIEDTSDANLKTLVKIVEDYGVDQVRNLIIKSKDVKSDTIVTTAHKSKGLEFNRVTIEGDFQYKIDGNNIIMNREEARLIYVALTRARTDLHLAGIYNLLAAIKNPNINFKFSE